MATAMLTVRYCDRCLTEKDEQVPADAMPDVQGMNLDLCAEHAAPLMEALAVYERYGAKGDRTMRAPLQLTPSGKRRRGQGDLTCPGCGRTGYLNRGSLSAHVRQTHDTSLSVLEGRPADVVCDDCGQTSSPPSRGWGCTSGSTRGTTQPGTGQRSGQPGSLPSQQAAAARSW